MSTVALDLTQPSIAHISRSRKQAIGEELSPDLVEWWSREGADWDAQVEGNSVEPSQSTDDDSDLWESMPTVDSKTVARASPIFERHLGRPLSINLIRPGGYAGIDDMIRHLVPAMMDESQARRGIRAVK